MTDDILDVTSNTETLGKTVGKDEKENKLTCIKVYGLEGAKIRAEECALDCHCVLEGVDGDVSFLRELVDYVLKRAN
jgi:geranylgeranyl pyrophosphate synthase